MRIGPGYTQHPFSTLELDSRNSGWRSLLLQRFTLASSADGAELPAVAAQTVVLTLRGRYRISSLKRTGRDAAEQRPGDLGMRAPGCADVLRWSSDGGPAPTLVQVHLPDRHLQRLADELRTAGSRPKRMPDTLKSYDPTVARVLRDLLVAARAGAPDLVAASAGQYLAAHLLTRHQGEELPAAPSTAGRRIGAVKHLLHAAYPEDLPLDALAREAGISPFHLIRVFPRAGGCHAAPLPAAGRGPCRRLRPARHGRWRAPRGAGATTVLARISPSDGWYASSSGL